MIEVCPKCRESGKTVLMAPQARLIEDLGEPLGYINEYGQTIYYNGGSDCHVCGHHSTELLPPSQQKESQNND